MGRADFDMCSDEEIRAAVYESAAKKAARWSKTAKKQIERESKTEGPPGVFRYVDLEDWFAMAIAKHFELESLFPELFEGELAAKMEAAWEAVLAVPV